MQKINIGSTYGTYVADQADTTYVLGRDDTMIATFNEAIDATSAVAGRVFNIYGSIYGNTYGINVGDFLPPSEPVKINIGRTGFVIADDTAVALEGDGNLLRNAGTLSTTSASGVAVYTGGDDAVIENSGMIFGSVGVNFASSARLFNSGNIAGDLGVRDNTISGTSTKIINSGNLTGNIYAIQAGSGDLTVVNRGNLNGNSQLGAGNDTFINRGGTVHGKIEGGLGDDRYVVDNAKIDIVEGSSAGFDTVKSSVSWTLDANFEMLMLTGAKNIDGQGNSMNNFVQGNKARNELYGEAGADYLNGGKGNDRLWGGSGADNFDFVRNGGRNLIMDFEAGVDHINITAFDGIDSFNDLMKHHIAFVGDDLIISAGNDVLVLKHTQLGDLDAGTFSL